MLPKGLEKLLTHILEDHSVQSWKYYMDNTSALSIRFKPLFSDHTDQYERITDFGQAPIDRQKSYRAKSPSTVKRDSERQQQWLNSKQYDRHVESLPKPTPLFSCDSGFVANGDINAHMDDMSTPLHHNATPKSYIAEEASVFKVDHNVPSCAMTTYNDTSQQTDKDTTHAFCQTEYVSATATSVSIQCPSLKKRGMQTTKVASSPFCMQTENADAIDQGCQCTPKPPTMSHASTTTLSLTDKLETGTATDPPEHRHVQTNVVKTKQKRCGKAYSNSGAQTDMLPNMNNECQTDSDDEWNYYSDYEPTPDDYYDDVLSESELRKQQQELSLSVAKIHMTQTSIVQILKTILAQEDISEATNMKCRDMMKQVWEEIT